MTTTRLGAALRLAIRSEVAQLPERPRNDLAAGWCCPLGLVVIRPGPWVIDCIGASETGGEKRSHQAGGHTLGTRHSWKAFPVGPRSCLRRQMGQSCRWTTSSHPLAESAEGRVREGVCARGRVREGVCARGGTRTPTSLRTLAPKASASANSATLARPIHRKPGPGTTYRDRGPRSQEQVPPTARSSGVLFRCAEENARSSA
jgi:hypothetical protein